MKKKIQEIDAISSREYRCRYYDLMSRYGFSQLFYGNEMLDFKDFLNVVLNAYGLAPTCTDIKHAPFFEYVKYKVGAQIVKKFDISCSLGPTTAVIAERGIYADKNFDVRNKERLAQVIGHSTNFGQSAGAYDRFFSINIADFIVWEEKPEFIHCHDLKFVKLDEEKYQIYNITIELPKFNKQLNELSSELDRWIYLLKNMGELKGRPGIYNSPAFKKLFRKLEVSWDE